MKNKNKKSRLLLNTSLITAGIAIGILSGFWIYKDREAREYSQEFLKQKARRLKKYFGKDKKSPYDDNYEDVIGI